MELRFFPRSLFFLCWSLSFSLVLYLMTSLFDLQNEKRKSTHQTQALFGCGGGNGNGEQSFRDGNCRDWIYYIYLVFMTIHKRYRQAERIKKKNPHTDEWSLHLMVFLVIFRQKIKITFFPNIISFHFAFNLNWCQSNKKKKNRKLFSPSATCSKATSMMWSWSDNKKLKRCRISMTINKCYF